MYVWKTRDSRTLRTTETNSKATKIPSKTDNFWRLFSRSGPFATGLSFPLKKMRHISLSETCRVFYFLYKPKRPMICCICTRSPSGRLSDTAASKAFCSSLERLPPCAKASPYSRKTSSRSNPVLPLLFSWASLISRSLSSPSACICAFVQMVSIQCLLLYQDFPGVHDAYESIQPRLFTLGQAGANG